jgi:pimeloyl-ACP methyl ester carboxylesterase
MPGEGSTEQGKRIQFMNYRIFLLFVILLTGCATTQPTPSITPSSTLTALPKETAVITPTLFLSPTPATLPPGQEIIFEESGSNKFTGTSYGTGKTAIVLANMSIGGAKQWDPFIAALDQQKFTTVTFNYRNIEAPDEDIRLVFDKLKEEGFQRVVCIGASLGTSACNAIAREPEMAGLVLIAGRVPHSTVAEVSYPKLFIVAALDPWAYDIQTGYEKAAEPKRLIVFENDRAHGTDLFRSQNSDAFLSALIDFVNGFAG